MRTAIISDIHGNLEALTAVLQDIESRGVDRIVCLGDIVGYGPNPRECVDVVMNRCEWSLMGNHDFAVLYEPISFNAPAEYSAFWTRRRLESEPSNEMRAKRWEYLSNLPLRMRIGKSLWVHASPRKPINEYVFPEDVVSSPGKMSQLFDRIDSCCFIGHTHVPGVFTQEPDFTLPAAIGYAYRIEPGQKCMINPGSVGQPRDRDIRASYAILTDDRVEFIRVEYDVYAVVEKVKSFKDLSDFVGLRLLEGR